MREPPPRSLFAKKSPNDSFADPPNDSWLNRVRENLAQLLLPSHYKPSSANGAPIHLLQLEKSRRPARAQGASLLTHAAVFAALFLLLARVSPLPPPPGHPFDSTPLTHYQFPIFHTVAGPHPSEGRGSGGDLEPIPATSGNPPIRSQIQLVKPMLPQSQNSSLPVPPTILDLNAAPALSPTTEIGLPWMPKDTNSPGPGSNHGIGTGKDGTLGDGSGGPFGIGSSDRPYGPGFLPPSCSYCPYPIYSDDARKAKVQGSVMLEVLVGADGRAQDIRVVKGLGFGLDDRAIQTVRAWKFVPARDSAKRPVSAWITVEAVFRLL